MIRVGVGKETKLYPWGRRVISYACHSDVQVTTLARYKLAPLFELRYQDVLRVYFDAVVFREESQFNHLKSSG